MTQRKQIYLSAAELSQNYSFNSFELRARPHYVYKDINLFNRPYVTALQQIFSSSVVYSYAIVLEYAICFNPVLSRSVEDV